MLDESMHDLATLIVEIRYPTPDVMFIITIGLPIVSSLTSDF